MADNGTSIELKGITQVYPNPAGGDDVTIVGGVDLSYDKPSINFLLGPSGSGKTTLLRMMGGYRPDNVKTPTSGEVLINGEACTGPHDDVVMVFQDYAIFPFRTVRQNIAYPFSLGLWATKIEKKEVEDRVNWILDRTGLTERQHNRPYQLSGGQKQRVALATALVLKPRILLMDEPFRGLDAQTLREMQQLLVSLWEEVKCLVVFVSHDIDEALTIGDKVTILTTQPATVAEEINLTTDRKVRDETWLRTTRVEEMRLRIMDLLRV